MRFPLLFILGSAVTAVAAQTPRPAPAPPRPAAPAPRPAPRAAPLAPDLEGAFTFPGWARLELDAPNLASLEWDLQGLADVHLAPLAREWQIEAEPLLRPEFQLDLAAGAPMAWTMGDAGEPRGPLARTRPEQGTPEDSLYRLAREALNRGEYTRASGLFQTLEQKFPRSRVAPAALYWRAFALYRAGSTEELRAALETQIGRASCRERV